MYIQSHNQVLTIKYRCSYAVNVFTLISNCGKKLDMRVISSRPMTTPFNTTSPVKLPRKRCDMAASSVVLPAPLQPNMATKLPVFIWPLTALINYKQLFKLICVGF